MEIGMKDTRRRGRKTPRKTVASADAFRVLSEPAIRPKFGFLNDTDIDFMRCRAFELLAEYGVVVIHPRRSRR